jgi:hypothetical protein
MLAQLHETISMCLLSVSEARVAYRSKSKHLHFISILASGSFSSGGAIQLTDVQKAVTAMRKIGRQNANKMLVVCVNSKDIQKLFITAILVGAYMILGLQMSFDYVEAAFKSIAEKIQNPASENDGGGTIFDAWKALWRVRKLGWVNNLVSNFAIEREDAEEEAACPCLDIDEWTHYSNPANGSLHIIAPGRLLLIPSPKDFPDGRDWMDVKGTRRFSSEFYADLLGSEFGVVLVLSLAYDDEVVEYDSAAFDRRGIAVENVPLGPRGAAQHHLLFAADRVLANLRAAPGPVAVHMHGGGTGCGDRLGLLLATGLVSVFGFTAGEAAAWLQMACPPLRAPAAQLCAEFGPLAAVGRTASAPDCWSFGELAGSAEWVRHIGRTASS